MNKKVLFVSLFFSIILFVLLISFTAYEISTTYNAHATFSGYCHWRGLEVVNQSSDYGYCKDLNSGYVFKIVLVNGRWYLNGDLPNNWIF